jgi:hypothetical protein
MSIGTKSLLAVLALSAVAGTSACQTARDLKTEARLPSGDSQRTKAGSPDSDRDDIVLPEADTLSETSLDFLRADKDSSFKFVHSGKNQKVLSADGRILLTFETSPKKAQKVLKVSNAAGKCSGYINLANFNYIKIEDAGRKDLYQLRFEKDNHFKLKDPQGINLCTIAEQNNMLQIEAARTGKTIYRVLTRGTRAELQSADGKTVLSAKAGLPLSVLACFGLDELSKEQQYSLAYALVFLKL